ncbi:hypothetical protein [Halalkalicoccus jeotgali]|uniref:Uncharacterized protein n=1 Tax=Halalkalicoccus jeotgali (strain DSM 18796 / CECT 7217 / JCM 14584 / KCTC 4019 / B3) TaxID=795797 RepID=D8J7Y4_HALJB|nr:hypothetical protein [Halalkalicoccus jeotgali]ADJ14097.1 hypothetical protein HacjB3_03530 [Halalkalicoccus jeotgali B3]ELY34473.1 hypothetical protein C497_15772 [Halalkalicoccus jeotgali B3]
MSEHPSEQRDRTGDRDDLSSERVDTSRRNFMISAGTAATMMGGGYAAQEHLREAMRDEPAKGGKVRHFDVHAVEVDIVYNAFGVHQPNGTMYVLEENGQLTATVHEPSDMAPEGVVEMLSDTTIEVVNAPIVEPVEAVEDGVDDASEDPDEVDVDDPLAEPMTPSLDGEQLNGFAGAELMVDTPTMDEPANSGTLIEDVTVDEGTVTLEWADESTTTFTNVE